MPGYTLPDTPLDCPALCKQPPRQAGLLEANRRCSALWVWCVLSACRACWGCVWVVRQMDPVWEEANGWIFVELWEDCWLESTATQRAY